MLKAAVFADTLYTQFQIFQVVPGRDEKGIFIILARGF
jgi:hypothetical protein